MGEINGTISGCSSSASVTGDGDVGGLVGNSTSGTISGCSSSGSVTGDVPGWRSGGVYLYCHDKR